MALNGELKLDLDPRLVRELEEYAEYRETGLKWIVGELLATALAADKTWIAHRKGGAKTRGAGA